MVTLAVLLVIVCVLVDLRFHYRGLTKAAVFFKKIEEHSRESVLQRTERQADVALYFQDGPLAVELGFELPTCPGCGMRCIGLPPDWDGYSEVWHLGHEKRTLSRQSSKWDLGTGTLKSSFGNMYVAYVEDGIEYQYSVPPRPIPGERK